MRDLFGEPSVGANGIDVAGVDEVGRGPLAGPVVAGAVILDPTRQINGLKDSKELTPEKREELAAQIRDPRHGLGARSRGGSRNRPHQHSAGDIGRDAAAVDALAADVRVAYIDGNMAPSIDGCATVTVIGGDGIVPAISAASIIAKVARDAEMVAVAKRFPGYGFERHKG